MTSREIHLVVMKAQDLRNPQLVSSSMDLYAKVAASDSNDGKVGSKDIFISLSEMYFCIISV